MSFSLAGAQKCEKDPRKGAHAQKKNKDAVWGHTVHAKMSPSARLRGHISNMGVFKVARCQGYLHMKRSRTAANQCSLRLTY